MEEESKNDVVSDLVTVSRSAKLVALVRNPTQYTIFHMVLERHIDCLSKDLSKEELQRCLDAYSSNKSAKYWAILHDKDVDEVTGEIKHAHYHIIIKYPSRHVKNAVIKDMAKLFGTLGLKDENGKNIGFSWISVRDGLGNSDLVGNIRYLMHLDNVDKVSYKETDMMTNDRDYMALAISGGITIEYLIEVVKGATKSDIAKAIGLENYLRYRWVILDLDKEFN